MGRPKRFSTRKAFEKAWEQYKAYCDNRTIMLPVRTKGAIVVQEVLSPITYTVEGFCKWAKISRSAYYETYEKTKEFSDIATRVREECECDAREKFESGLIDAKLAGLWMSRYGYGKERMEDSQEVAVQIEGMEEYAK